MIYGLPSPTSTGIAWSVWALLTGPLPSPGILDPAMSPSGTTMKTQPFLKTQDGQAQGQDLRSGALGIQRLGAGRAI